MIISAEVFKALLIVDFGLLTFFNQFSNTGLETSQIFVSGNSFRVGQTNYGAAKAGIAAFTIIAARELGRIGVTVNSISPTAYTRMTDTLREYTEEDIERRDPRWVSPTIVYLSSAEANDITGRVIQAGNGRVAVCEGWRRGAEIDQIEDAEAIGPLIREMISNVRKNSGMDGLELD